MLIYSLLSSLLFVSATTKDMTSATSGETSLGESRVALTVSQDFEETTYFLYKELVRKESKKKDSDGLVIDKISAAASDEAREMIVSAQGLRAILEFDEAKKSALPPLEKQLEFRLYKGTKRSAALVKLEKNPKTGAAVFKQIPASIQKRELDVGTFSTQTIVPEAELESGVYLLILRGEADTGRPLGFYRPVIVL